MTVTSLPTRSCSRGKRYAEPLNLFFPQIFVITNIEPSISCEPHHYSLDADPGPYGPRAVVAPVEHPLPAGQSIIVRHHHNKAQAGAYMLGFGDAGTDTGMQNRENADGHFSMVEIPTQHNWPSPLFLFSALHTVEDHPLGFIHWEFAWTADGRILDIDDIGALFNT